MGEKHEQNTAGKHESGLRGKTGMDEKSGKNTQYNSGSGGEAGKERGPVVDDASGHSGTPGGQRQNPGSGAGRLEGTTNQGFGRGKDAADKSEEESRH